MLQRGFLTRRRSLQLSRQQVFFGVGIGIAYAIMFYHLVVGFREIIRLSSFESIRLTYNQLSAGEAFFYNLFIAFWACLIGFSNAIEYWATTSRQHKLARYLILNDSRATLSFFNYWFAKMGWLYLASCIFFSSYNGFNLFHDYWFLFPMMAVVLFMSQWIRIRRYVANSLRLMFLAGAGFICLSIGMAATPVFDSARSDELARKQGPGVNVKLPDSRIKYRPYRRHLVHRVFVGYPENSPSEARLVDENRIVYSETEATELVSTVTERAKSYTWDGELEDVMIQLYADKAVPTRTIKAIMNGFRYSNFEFVLFVTDTVDFERGVRARVTEVCREMIPKQYADTSQWFIECEYYAEYYEPERLLRIKLTNDQFQISGQQFNPEQLYEAAKAGIVEGRTFFFDIDDNSSYESLVRLYDILNSAAVDLWASVVKAELDLKYDENTDDPEIQKFIRNRYPLYIVQWTEEDIAVLEQASKQKHR